MADIVTSRVFVDGEKGITAQKLNDIVASSVIQPAFYTSKPTAGTADPTDIALILKSGGYAQVPISTLGGSATQAQIWSTRLRSFNAIGNPNFEVDQRNVGQTVSNPVSGSLIVDRWGLSKTGTMVLSSVQHLGAPGVPGTSFQISSKYLALILTTQQSSLGVGDYWSVFNVIEGSTARELFSDVSSFSLLVSSSVAGLNFAVSIRDSPATKSLVKLCTIPAANTWTLITLPNLPVFPSGNFVTTPGQAGYQLSIVLACGTTLMAPAADTWQTGNFLGAPGMSNFANSPVNSIFQIAMVQHEPGSVCSTFIDKPFFQNYEECLRYYQKSYDPEVMAGTVTSAGALGVWQQTTTILAASMRFHKPMAKTQTVTVFNHATGAPNSTRINGVDYAVSSVGNVGKSGFLNINTSTAMPAPVAGSTGTVHYTADTGW